MTLNTVSDSTNNQGAEVQQNAFSKLLALHDETWSSLSKAKSVASALIADDQAAIISYQDLSNLISVIEGLVDSAMIGVERNWELIRQYKNAVEVRRG